MLIFHTTERMMGKNRGHRRGAGRQVLSFMSFMHALGSLCGRQKPKGGKTEKENAV